MKSEIKAIEQFNKDVQAIDPHKMAALAASMTEDAEGVRLTKAFRLIHGAIVFLRKAQSLETERGINFLTATKDGASTIEAAQAVDGYRVYSFAEAAQALGYVNESGLERLIQRTFTPKLIASRHVETFLPGGPKDAKGFIANVRHAGVSNYVLENLRDAKRNLHSEQGRKNRIKGLKRTARRKPSK